MAVERFDFCSVFAFNGRSLQWACKQLVAGAATRYELRSLYNLFATMMDIAYQQGDTLIGDYFNGWRKKLDCACNQNALFARVLIKVNKGGKCYDARLIKAR